MAEEERRKKGKTMRKRGEGKKGEEEERDECNITFARELEIALLSIIGEVFAEEVDSSQF